MAKKSLKFRDIERLENTSFATLLGGADGSEQTDTNGCPMSTTCPETYTCPSDTCPSATCDCASASCECPVCVLPTSCCGALLERVRTVVGDVGVITPIDIDADGGAWREN